MISKDKRFCFDLVNLVSFKIKSSGVDVGSLDWQLFLQVAKSPIIISFSRNLKTYLRQTYNARN